MIDKRYRWIIKSCFRLIDRLGFDGIPILMAVKTSIYLPNALKVDSPINGTLCVYATSDIVTVISFRLYDRWGNLHFDESGPIIDGRYCVSNSTIWSELQSGVYVYAVELQKSDGDTIIELGNVTVFK